MDANGRGDLRLALASRAAPSSRTSSQCCRFARAYCADRCSGKEIWAGRSMTKRVVGADGKLSKVVRLNAPHADGRESLGQAEIARWPHEGRGIDLGRLGEVIPSAKLPAKRIRAQTRRT
jgi:hypothetical protein